LCIDKQKVRERLGIKQKFVLIWSGHLGGFTTYDVLFLIKAISISKNKNNILLILAAMANENEINLISLFANKLNVNLKYVGFLEKKSYLTYLFASDVGVFIRPSSLFSHFLTGRKVMDYTRLFYICAINKRFLS